MSHINDLLGVVRGLRLVVEAGLKLQQENSRLIWNNSSLRPLLQTCPTNPLTSYKPSSDTTGDLLERLQVVAQGFRHYAIMNVPNYQEANQFDSQIDEEIEELNREFNKTFESLKKAEKTALRPVEIIAPLENLCNESTSTTKVTTPLVSQMPPPLTAKDTVPSVVRPEEVEVTSPATSEDNTPKPIAKKKIRVSVS